MYKAAALSEIFLKNSLTCQDREGKKDGGGWRVGRGGRTGLRKRRAGEEVSAGGEKNDQRCREEEKKNLKEQRKEEDCAAVFHCCLSL